MLKRPAAIVTTAALLMVLAGCLPGDPDPSPVGLISVQGQPAAVVPNCDGEKVLGITVEADAYDQKPVTGSLPDRYLVSIETTRRNAGSFLERSKITTLKDGQVLINGDPGSLDSLTELWGY